jgi:succinoglycan biosynthesis transport protein ExoP
MDLMYLLHSLLRKKWIIIFCSVLGLAAGFAFTMVQPKLYESVSQYSTGFTMEKKVSIAKDESINIYEIDLRFNNVIETFKSPKVMGMLSYKLMLHDLEDSKPFRKLSDEKKKKNEYVLVNHEKAKQILRRKIADLDLLNPFDPEERKVFDLIGLYKYDGWSLSGGLSFSRVERSDFINIYFRSENPELSAFVVNTIGEQFIRFFNSIYGVRSQESTAKLDSLVAEKKRVVDSLTTKLQEYRAKIGTPNVADRASAAMSVVSELTSNYQREQARLSILRGELAAVEIQLRNVSSSIPADAGTSNSNAEYLALRRQNENLELEKAGKSAEEVRRIQDQIDANLRKMQQLSGSVSPGTARTRELAQTQQSQLVDRKIELQQQILAAENNVKMFKEQKAQYERLTSSGGGEEVILRAKEDELRIASQEYESLKKSLQASLDLDVNPENNFKQTLVGQPAFKPQSARRTLILGLSGALMFFLSSFIIVGLEFLDTSFKTPSIFQRTTKLRLLTSLNKIDLKRKEVSDYFHVNGDSERADDELTFVQNLRKLRYELENSGKKIFLVTSTKPGEGKTTIIESLANSLCLTKKKVLLIDANFSNNTLTRKFEAKPTLEQFSMNGQANAVDKFWSITSMTTIPNTDIVGCSEGNHTPAEVLPKSNLLENLPRIAESYDYVFVEGAALNNHADSKELSKYVDGIIVVFSARSVFRQTDKESVQFLKSTGEKFMGSVLNYVDLDSMKL